MPWKDLIPVLAALSGAVVGGVMTGFHSGLQDRRNRQRALRALLSQLLELRFHFRKQDPASLKSLMVEAIGRRFGQAVAMQLDQGFTTTMVQQVLATVPTESHSQTVRAQYEAAVEAIAPYDPWLAYHLRGSSSALDLPVDLAGDFERALQKLAAGQPLPVEIQEVPMDLASSVVDTARDAIDRAIRDTAFALSLTDWIRAQWWLYRRRKPSQSQTRDIDELLDRLADRLKSADK